MYLRYPTQCPATVVGSGSATYSTDMPNIFLEWNEEDPVSQYEMNRNTVLQNMQGNRNPFIDNPYLATRIWSGPSAQDTWGTLTAPELALANFVLYPTVTSGLVYANSQEEITYSVYNNLGQQVNVTVSGQTIDLTNNANGIYYIKAGNQSANKFFTIIKQ